MAEWTSMDTPPEETGTYLCAVGGACGAWAILSWAPWPDCRGWYTVDGRGNVKPYNGPPVTHWMPLPDLPSPGACDEA